MHPNHQIIFFLRSFSIILLIPAFVSSVGAQIHVAYQSGLEKGARILESAFFRQGWQINEKPGDAEWQIRLSVDSKGSMGPEGFEINVTPHSITVKGGGVAGALYGAYELAEQISLQKGINQMTSWKQEPTFEVRAIKFNLPWSAYRESKSMDYHLATCRDLKFWEAFLDMMLENRFNTLLLYNKHPFPYMVKLEEYPEACPFSEEEMQEWQEFWKSLFAIAKARGIEVFIVNWNIVVSPGFAEHHQVPEYNDTSLVTIDYTRRSVTQLINTYEDLAGVGVTLADWMNGQTPAQRENWIKATFIEGMRQAGRKVKFLHRAVLSGSSDEMRRVLRDTAYLEPVLTEVKFNWSHGHSTPKLFITHASESGEVNTGFWEPAPENYKIQWMIRNEDFFILRWGDAEFIRDHIRENTKPYMNGYHIGSEGYIPAYDYFTKNETGRTWQYAFQRQWLFYKMWGRLLYDKELSDEAFILDLEQWYGTGKGEKMLKAYQLASKTPLRLASFFKSTWDYTLYSEGFLSAMHQDRYGQSDGHSPFISINELIDHQVLDNRYLSIRQYADLLGNGSLVPAGKTTPLQLAAELLANADAALQILQDLDTLTSPFPVAYRQELDDIRIWSFLSRYFGYKLKAAVHLERYRRNGNQLQQELAVEFLEQCLKDWTAAAETGKKNYREVPYWEGSVFGFEDKAINNFSWEKYLTEVERDLEIAQED